MTRYWSMKRIHFMNSKCAAELFFWSAAKGYLAFMQRVIDKDESLPAIRGGLNATSKHDSMTALHLACKYGRENSVELLLKTECDVNKVTKSGKHALSIAIEKGNINIVKLIVQVLLFEIH